MERDKLAEDFEWLAEELRATPRYLWDQLLLEFCEDLLAQHRASESASISREPCEG